MSRKTRNATKCTRYKAEQRREKSKLRKLLKLQKTHPKDNLITKCIEKLRGLIK